VLRRSTLNRGRALQAEGCAERLDLDFLRWVWRYPAQSRPRLDALIEQHLHLRVVEVTSRRQAWALLDRVTSS